MKSITTSVPKSAASKSIDIATLASLIALLLYSKDCIIGSASCVAIALIALVNSAKCCLDVQEMNMHFLNAIFKKLCEKDKDDNK